MILSFTNVKQDNYICSIKIIPCFESNFNVRKIIKRKNCKRKNGLICYFIISRKLYLHVKLSLIFFRRFIKI